MPPVKYKGKNASAKTTQTTTFLLEVPLSPFVVREISKFEVLADWYLDNAQVTADFDYKAGVLRFTFSRKEVLT